MVVLHPFFFQYFNVFFLLFGLLVSFILNLNFKKKNTQTFFLKNVVIFFFTISFCIFLLGLSSVYLTNRPVTLFLHTDFCGTILVLLVYIVGLVSLITLSDRFWFQNRFSTLLFLYFPVVVFFLIKSKGLLEAFFFYELLLLPSVYFVYGTAYTRRSQQANTYFFLWTQIGSMVSLVGVAVVIALCGSSDYSTLLSFNFSKWESTVIYSLFFLGFGVKVPIWPFHFWLTKVHVEAPSGFSIFLSGFLVKTAVYCFYKFTLFFGLHYFHFFFPLICIMGMLDGSIKMWGQTDVKKMIAYATVQEMNAIFLFFTINDSTILIAGFIFLFAHGTLSSLMFYIVELLYKRTHSRSIYKVSGISEIYPNLSVSVWTMLILFFGFPGTMKFFAEFYLISLFLEFDVLIALFVSFVFIFVGTVGFCKNWFSILYGHPGSPTPTTDLTREEVFVVSFLFLLSILPSLLLLVI